MVGAFIDGTGAEFEGTSPLIPHAQVLCVTYHVWTATKLVRDIDVQEKDVILRGFPHEIDHDKEEQQTRFLRSAT